MAYGKELILDLHYCNSRLFNRKSIEEFMVKICDVIKMERCELHIWSDDGLPESEKQTSPQTKGTSAVQFILTSNITIHTLDLLKNVYVNIFSCKDFDADEAEFCTETFFQGDVIQRYVIERK